MHINFHAAIGVIIATVTDYFIPLQFFQYGFIVICAFGMDADILLKKYAKYGNHRNLITHSIYPSIIILIIGIILHEIWIIIGAMAYWTHLIFDLTDWGTNLFYTGETKGLKLLLQGQDPIELSKNLPSDPAERQWFFTNRYYSTSWVIILEITGFILMLILLILFNTQNSYYIILYALLLGFHLYERKKILQAIRSKTSK